MGDGWEHHGRWVETWGGWEHCGGYVGALWKKDERATVALLPNLTPAKWQRDKETADCWLITSQILNKQVNNAKDHCLYLSRQNPN